MTDRPCPICQGQTLVVGTKQGRRTGRPFALHRCRACGFGFVPDPWTDYAEVYDQAYYEGRGSDPSVDYAYEFAQPERTIRRYEWRGLTQLIGQLHPAPGRWLDYGCGNGGLVRHARIQTKFEIFGFDTGAWAERARSSGLPILRESDLPGLAGTFDVITAIEVMEHCVDPLDVLRQLRRLLRPGGILFLTTGNADYAPRDFTSWSYVNPEIHVSYFTPRALTFALEQTGFASFQRNRLAGWDDIIRFKVLKSLGVRNANWAERCLPWSLLARLADWKTGVSALPLGRAR